MTKLLAEKKKENQNRILEGDDRRKKFKAGFEARIKTKQNQLIKWNNKQRRNIK